MAILLPIFFIFICVFLLLMPLTIDANEVLWGIIMILSGVPIYLLGVAWRNKPRAFTGLVGKSSVHQDFFLSYVKRRQMMATLVQWIDIFHCPLSCNVRLHKGWWNAATLICYLYSLDSARIMEMGRLQFIVCYMYLYL